MVDYVIIGSGPAGFVLAEQLSQDPNVTIVLLEAGPDGTHAETINVPAYAPFNTNPVATQYVWNLTSQPDPNLAGQTPALAQGHTWGGGSAVNYMDYCRGAPSVFDEWAAISGDEELRWESLLDDFKATTHYVSAPSDLQEIVNASVYGHGPLEISHQSALNGFDPHYADALKAGLYLPEIDLNQGSPAIGVSLGVETIRVSNRTRDYALQAYGWQLVDRPNVKMIHNAWVSKIGFEGKRATHVTYLSAFDNETYAVKAKEVIASAGAIGSPKLLMLSGVGPGDHLQDLGIPVVADIPDIGSNLYDHHFSVLEVEVTPDVQSVWQLLYNATDTAITQAEYANHGKGPLGATDSGSFAIARVPDSVFEAVNDTFHTSLPADRGQLLYQYATAAFLPGPNISIISPFVALVQPEATGYIRLNSTDFRDDPLIYSNYYGSAGDKAAILYGYKKLRSILQSSIMAPVVVREVFPGANVTSDENIFAAIQKSAQTFHHPLGTVALGKVVDSDWRIKGLEGIRVVDSSTFPTPPTCHLQADVYAYAHRAARKIKQTDRHRRK